MRPILGLLPRGAAWDLLTDLNAGCCALPSDRSAGAAFLATCYDAFLRKSPPPGVPRLDQIAGYERRALCGRLASLLDSVREDAPSVPSDRS